MEFLFIYLGLLYEVYTNFTYLTKETFYLIFRVFIEGDSLKITGISVVSRSLTVT